MEQGRERIAPVPVNKRRGTNVLCWTAGAGEDRVRYQVRGPPALVQTGNGHQHRSTGVGRIGEREE